MGAKENCTGLVLPGRNRHLPPLTTAQPAAGNRATFCCTCNMNLHANGVVAESSGAPWGRRSAGASGVRSPGQEPVTD